MGKHLGRAVGSGPRRGGQVAGRPGRQKRPGAERLEERALMSTIVWDNSGGPGQSDRDGFTAAFGPNAPLARAIVRQAIHDWEQVIVNFNYTHVGEPRYARAKNTFGLAVFAANLPPGVPGRI